MMMEEIGETCKLCLKYIQGVSLATLDNDLLGKLDFLQINLDHSVEKSNSICKDCEEKIDKVFNFKCHIVDAERIEPKNLNPLNVPSTSADEFSTENVQCYLCKKSVNHMSLISLTKLLKDESMMEVFQGHITEIELTTIDGSKVCISCQTSLAVFSILISSWAVANDLNDEDMKEDVDDYEMLDVKEEKDEDSSDCYNEVSDNAKIVENVESNKGETIAKVKNEIDDDLSESSETVCTTTQNIKEEESNERVENEEIQDLQLKNDEIDIKNEDEDGRYKAFSKEYKVYLNQLEKNKVIVADVSQLYVCHKCGFKATNERNLLDHLIVHKQPEKPKIYSCKECSFKSKHKRSLKIHWFKHKDPNEKETYKCQYCSYESGLKQCVAEHSKIHLDTKLLYKCDLCSFETKFRYVWRKHRQKVHNLCIVLNQKSRKKPDKNYRCHLCEFETHKKNSLVKHVLVHRKIDEVENFKCPECTYKSKYKSSLTRHALTHKSYDEVVTFQCTECAFRCKCQRNMRRHMTLHQRGNEKDILKCAFCTYTSKRAGGIASHIKNFHSDKCPVEDKPKKKRTKRKRKLELVEQETQK